MNGANWRNSPHDQQLRAICRRGPRSMHAHFWARAFLFELRQAQIALRLFCRQFARAARASNRYSTDEVLGWRVFATVVFFLKKFFFYFLISPPGWKFFLKSLNRETTNGWTPGNAKMKRLFMLDDKYHGNGSVVFAWHPGGVLLATAGINGQLSFIISVDFVMFGCTELIS